MFDGHTSLQIALPTWGCLDESSSWREFAEGAGQDAIAAAVAAFQPEAALGVDWHSLGAWQRLQQHLQGGSLVQVPFFYLNYRQSCSKHVYAKGCAHTVHSFTNGLDQSPYRICHSDA